MFNAEAEIYLLLFYDYRCTVVYANLRSWFLLAHSHTGGMC